MNADTAIGLGVCAYVGVGCFLAYCFGHVMANPPDPKDATYRTMMAALRSNPPSVLLIFLGIVFL